MYIYVYTHTYTEYIFGPYFHSINFLCDLAVNSVQVFSFFFYIALDLQIFIFKMKFQYVIKNVILSSKDL